MSKFECNQRHLTLPERAYIEHAILLNESFVSIAKALHKDPSTISKEIRNNRHCIPAAHPYFTKRCKGCMNYSNCSEMHVCDNNRCRYHCRLCSKLNPTNYCAFFLGSATRHPNRPMSATPVSCLIPVFWNATNTLPQRHRRTMNNASSIHEPAST